MAFLVAAALVLLAFLWAISRTDRKDAEGSIARIGECEKRSIVYWPQIQQALSGQDLEYVKRRAPRCLPQLSRERRGVTFEYLRGLKGDFEQMLHLATAIAVLSPEVKAVHEWERLRLTAQFRTRYRIVQLCVLLRVGSMDGMHQLNDTVSRLMVKLDDALSELGEHAALALELRSSLDGGTLGSS